MKDAVNSACISEFIEKRDNIIGHRLFEHEYNMPLNINKVINFRIRNQMQDESFKKNCQNFMKMVAAKINNLSTFINSVIFSSNN